MKPSELFSATSRIAKLSLISSPSMDSPIVSQLFKQLFRHHSCHSLRSHSSLPFRIAGSPQIQRRKYATGPLRRKADDDPERRTFESDWQQRLDWMPADRSEEIKTYPRVTAEALRVRKTRPRRVKMLARDFIEDSLYNPHYGYFSKQAVIFSPGEPFDFNNMADGPEFNRALDQRYVAFEDALDAQEENETRQLWHTPTELFRPYYGEAIARYLVTNYKLTLYPYHDLIIYEMGAGNGTFMLNVLDYIRDTDPDVYARTKFKIIEVSPMLAEMQKRNLRRSLSYGGHTGHAEIINCSIFDWKTFVPAPCFFVALEVFDNFGHDSIRYDPVSEEPLQGNVLIDRDGEFFEFYSKELDPISARYLRVRAAAARSPFKTPISGSRLLRKWKAQLPLSYNLTVPEYIPTRLMQFFDILRDFFPAHRLVVSDFSSLPAATPGINAPVVQTRYQRRNVTVRTPFVHQGYFDIFFPTDFKLMEDVYRAITGKLTRVLTQEEFLRRWAYVEDTTTRNGENPLLSWYKNASVLTTV